MDEQEIAENVNPASEDAETVVSPETEQTEAVPAAGDPAEPAVPDKVFEPRVHKPVVPEMLDRTRKDLLKMLDFLGYEDAVVKAAESNGEIELSVESEDAGRIIGRKGQTLESLQLLLNRMMQKDDPEYPRILISIDGYSARRPDSRGRAPREQEESSSEHRRGGDRRHRGERGDRRRRDDREERGGDRDDILRQQALDAAKEVRRWGEPKTLPAMNAHDRRVIHITLENEADLQTESEGDGPKKAIVISLKK